MYARMIITDKDGNELDSIDLFDTSADLAERAGTEFAEWASAYGYSIDDDELDWHWASEDELSRTRYGEERTEAIAQAHLDAYAEYYG